MPKSNAEKNPLVSVLTDLPPPRNRFNLNTPKEVKPEEHNDKARDNIYRSLILSQEASYRSCQRSQHHKHDGKSGNKAERTFQRFARSPFTAACKTGNVDGQHREQAR